MAPLRKRDMRLRPATTEEINEVWAEHWYGLVVCLGTVYKPQEVDGLALVDLYDEVVGLVTYQVDGPAGQIVTLDTIVRGRGFGRRLLEAVENKFHNLGLGRAWALMTNDNLRAAGLYLSRGYRLVRVHSTRSTGSASTSPNCRTGDTRASRSATCGSSRSWGRSGCRFPDATPQAVPRANSPSSARGPCPSQHGHQPHAGRRRVNHQRRGCGCKISRNRNGQKEVCQTPHLVRVWR